ncbi:MAG: hypothetical protein AAGA32_08945, partial [Pseudomonadota bacterium]
ILPRDLRPKRDRRPHGNPLHVVSTDRRRPFPATPRREAAPSGAGLSWPLPHEMTDAALEALLYPPAPFDAATIYPKPDWAHVHRETRRPSVTLSLQWEEEREAHPEGYGYGRFYEP